METGNIRDRLTAWERLRVVYNVVMLFVGIPVAVSVYHAVNAIPAEMRRGLTFSYTPLSVLTLSIVFGLVANALFLLGPIVEIYAAAFTRFNFSRAGRITVFSLGLLFSLAVQGMLWIFYQTIGFAMMD